MKKPNIFDYLDAAQYLKSYFDWRKYSDPEFSQTKWSNEIGLGSKVTLRFILNRQRNISVKTMMVFKVNLKLTDLEADYFDILVKYSQAKTVVERTAFGASLIKFQRLQFSQKEISSEIVSKNVFSPLILTLLSFKDFEKNRKNIAQFFNLEEATVQIALDELVRLEVIRCNRDGNYQFEGNFKIQSSPNLRNFYEYWFDRAKSAIDLPSDTRKFSALTFALSSKEYDEFLSQLSTHAILLLSRFQNHHVDGRRIYIFTTSIFPVSAVAATTSNELKKSVFEQAV